jgi:acetylornithine/N-succinyldiaminopimelate aminotransferase
MRKDQTIKNFEKYILSTYTRSPLIFVKGKGMTLTDINGKKYLDFFPGWGVNNVGHCHTKVMSAVRDQIGKLIHVPNNFYHPNQVKLAKEIIHHSFKGKVYFCNSGAEGCEAAIKFARVFGKGKRFEIITMNNSFHGRTLGALAATGQAKYKEGFAPLPEGFKHVPFNDIEAVRSAATDKTVGVMLELVQGEGGVNIADPQYVKDLRHLCDQKNILLIFDEVQTGIGRTGKMFAYQHYGVEPDLMILAKGLGGGLPIGALVAKTAIADTFRPGMHATTFGGSPLITKAALGALKGIVKDHMLKNTQAMGRYLLKEMNTLKKDFACIEDVRGIGLMLGIQLNRDGKAVYEACLDNGLIINCTQGNILRLMPALNVTKKQADKAVFIIRKVLNQITQR